MKKAILMLIVISMLFFGCSSGRLRSEADDTGKKGSEKAVDAEVIQDIEHLEVDILEGEAEEGIIFDRAIGDASFVPQDDDKVTFDYHPEQEHQEITLTDVNGWQWTFSFPQYALTRMTQITFTPLSEIELDSLPGAEVSGFQMEPDGLTFLAYPTVSITKQGENGGGFLLSSTHDRSGVTISPASLVEGGLQGSIPHFSAWYLLPESSANKDSFEKYRKILSEQYEAAVKAAKELLKKPITVPPPPSIDVECFSEEKYQQSVAYAHLVSKEEAAIADNLLAVMREDQIVLGTAPDYTLPMKLMARVLAKIEMLFKTYQGQPDKLMAVAQAAVMTWRQYSLMGGESPNLARLIPWVEKTRKYYMDRLVSKHDYKAAGAVVQLSKLLILLGGEADVEELVRALTFKLKIKIAFSEDYGEAYGTITSEGEGEMVPQIISEKDLWSGEYIFFTGDIKIKTQWGAYYKELNYSPTKYTISAEVRNWDPCKSKSCDIWVSTLGLEEEKLSYGTGDEYEVFSEVLIWDFAYDFFSEELDKGFHADLNNLGESAVIQTFSGKDDTFGEVTLDVLFDLVHTPK